MKVIALIFLIAGTIINCNAQEMDLKKRLGTLLPVDLKGYKIVSWFSECGEWGGHKEEFLITAASNYSAICNFKMYSVNCDLMTKEGLVQKLVNDITFTIDAQKVSSLKEYFQGMLLEKLAYKFSGSNAGNFYGLYNSDSTLKIEFPGSVKTIDIYLKLKKELGVLKYR